MLASLNDDTRYPREILLGRGERVEGEIPNVQVWEELMQSAATSEFDFRARYESQQYLELPPSCVEQSLEEMGA